MTYRAGYCAPCGASLGGAGVLCDQCWIGRPSRDVPHYMRERLEDRLRRRDHFLRTGRATPIPGRWASMRRSR